MTADHWQAILWSLTYIFLIIHSLRYKTHGIPLTAIFLNFAWESVALFNSLPMDTFTVPILIRAAWFSLDLVIIALYFAYETKIFENLKEKIFFLCGYLISTVCLVFLFKQGYMLVSCFAIDLMMAIAFLCHLLFQYAGRNPLIYLIGLSKLLGDLCAWLYYREDVIVQWIGLFVFICNLIYLMVLVSQDGPLSLSRK